jgi:hypothetical protein
MYFNSHAGELWRTSNSGQHSVNQRLKNILTLLYSEENCRWGIIHFFEVDNFKHGFPEFEHKMEAVMLTKIMYDA